MDELDKYIEKVVKKDITVPKSFEEAIKTALYSKKFEERMKKRKIIKTLSTACITLALTSSLVFGGYIAYKKVWKEPKQLTVQELKDKIADSEVSREKKETLITEDVAKQNALEILNNLGYEGQQIEKIELQENKEEEINEVFYIIETNNNESYNMNINIKLDAQTGSLKALEDKSMLDKPINTESISKEVAEDISKQICKNIKFDLEELELSRCIENFQSRDENQKVWNTTFMKKYNNIVNPYEKIVMRFLVNNNNEVKIKYIYTVNDGIYENNSVVLTKEEAIEIAKNKEKELTNNEISEISAEQAIRMINTYIYDLEIGNMNENNMYEDSELISNNTREIRNVWKVKIKHKSDVTSNVNEYLKGVDKQYYIDITTGEIIGGKNNLIDG